MPDPFAVILTITSRCLPCENSAVIAEPASDNFTAAESISLNAKPSLSRSAMISNDSSGIRCVNVIALLEKRPWAARTDSAHNSRRSKAPTAIGWPSKSATWLIQFAILITRFVFSVMIRRYSRCVSLVSPARPSRIMRAYPRMAPSGVRKSWAMFDCTCDAILIKASKRILSSITFARFASAIAARSAFSASSRFCRLSDSISWSLAKIGEASCAMCRTASISSADR